MKTLNIKKPLIVLLALAMVATFAFNTAKPKMTKTTATVAVKWYDWNTGFAKAKKENKIILVDAYTDWCGWCKVMDKKTYTNKDVLAKMKKNFIAVKLNPEKGGTCNVYGKKMTCRQLHRWLGKGRTYGYPTTYFLTNPKSVKPNRYPVVGYIKAEQFKDALDKAVQIKKNKK